MNEDRSTRRKYEARTVKMKCKGRSRKIWTDQVRHAVGNRDRIGIDETAYTRQENME